MVARDAAGNVAYFQRKLNNNGPTERAEEVRTLTTQPEKLKATAATIDGDGYLGASEIDKKIASVTAVDWRANQLADSLAKVGATEYFERRAATKTLKPASSATALRRASSPRAPSSATPPFCRHSAPALQTPALQTPALQAPDPAPGPAPGLDPGLALPNPPSA